MAEFPDTKVIVLTGSRRPDWAREAKRLGFHGFVTKDSGLSQVVRAIVAVAGGQAVPFQPTAAAAGAVGAGRSPEEKHWALLAKVLTDREREILAMLVEGADSREIASRVGIMPNTVRTHIQNVLTKLQVHSRLEAAALATRAGLLGLPRPRTGRPRLDLEPERRAPDRPVLPTVNGLGVSTGQGESIEPGAIPGLS